VQPGAPVNILELLAAVAALLVFVYLLWAMLRPEDF
jgi:K+-transporting ATPase KdpF subunit